jgi:uncharacterized protein
VAVEKVSQVERGEEALRQLGFRQVRVRYQGSPDSGELVRIQVAPEELARALMPEMAARIREIFKELGFRYVTVDLEGYRQGSFNPP